MRPGPCICDYTGTCKFCVLYQTDEAYRARCNAAKVAEFGYAMAEELRWRSRGGMAPSAVEKAERRAICDSCPERGAAKDMCNLCGCYLEAGLLPPRPLGKLDCATQRCPKGLWGFVGGYANRACNCNKGK